MVYHSFTGGFILGEVIRRVAGQSLTEYLDSRLRQPLGMRYFTYGLDRRSRSRVAENHVAGQPVCWPVSRWARQVCRSRSKMSWRYPTAISSWMP